MSSQQVAGESSDIPGSSGCEVGDGAGVEAGGVTPEGWTEHDS